MSKDDSNKRVLIVEDHPDMRELLVWQIQLMGYTPVEASHAKEGLEKAVTEKPALILLDIMMPSMDGREAARALKDNLQTKDIPILATTALFREADLQSCLEAGCAGYLVKPFTFQELQSKLRELLAENTR
ncbi:MAG TPA: response regulator [Candidatus Binatia bacterium]|jgi:two-component system alkaline phosphatase synthesis response regulator PhoP